MQNFIGVYENSLSSENCKKIIEWFEKSPQLQEEGSIKLRDGKRLIKKEIKDSIDISLNFEEDGWVSDVIHSSIRNGLEKYKKQYHRELNICITRWGLTRRYNLQKYLPGGGYKTQHCENSSKDSVRMMAWMIYLNTLEDRGGTNFPSYELTEKAEEGKLLIWPAYWTHTHKGIPSPTESKYIATGWFEFV